VNVEKVESLLERSRPAPPPPDLRRRLMEAAALKVPRPSVPSHRPRFVEVMTMAASILMLLATFSWLLRETPPPPTPGTGQDGQPFEDRRMTDQLPSDHKVSGFSWSADGKHWACVATVEHLNADLAFAVIDGKRGREYMKVYPPVFGADGRCVYVAHDAKEGYVLVLDGVPNSEFDTYDSAVWSPDGKKLAFIASKDRKFHVVVDGKKSEPFDSIWELVWSPDGRTVAFTACLGQDWFCVVDGRKGEPFDAVRDLIFSPDGKTLAYAANEGSWMIVLGDKKGDEHDDVERPIFTADGTTFGYVASRTDRAFLVMGPHAPAMNAPTPFFEDLGPPAFSRDGRVWAYRAKPRESVKEQVMIGRARMENGGLRGEEVPDGLYDSVSDPVVSADGMQIAYAAGKGSRKYLVVGGKPTVKFSLIDRIAFGPDGRTVAFRAGQYAKQFVVAGGSRGDEFEEIVSGPVWSADGKKVAFTARNKSELWSKVLEVK
jgi:Tol biopolymer transport system component